MPCCSGRGGDRTTPAPCCHRPNRWHGFDRMLPLKLIFFNIIELSSLYQKEKSSHDFHSLVQLKTPPPPPTATGERTSRYCFAASMPFDDINFSSSISVLSISFRFSILCMRVGTKSELLPEDLHLSATLAGPTSSLAPARRPSARPGAR